MFALHRAINLYVINTPEKRLTLLDIYDRRCRMGLRCFELVAVVSSTKRKEVRLRKLITRGPMTNPVFAVEKPKNNVPTVTI